MWLIGHYVHGAWRPLATVISISMGTGVSSKVAIIIFTSAGPSLRLGFFTDDLAVMEPLILH